MFDFIKNISPIEWGVIVLVLLLLFGGKIVTKLGKTSGETVREIKKVKKTFSEALEDEPEKKGAWNTICFNQLGLPNG
jgi:Sec-independent protein translocase protein TatA